ncbi:MAG: MBL fold metallo-hydrolase [Christensenellaceae bacterium]|jgi:phosphoribosyl 1,2-cyclic phosphodiesterase|nr:MBL fold metallo-hydrolase [Christensenellaceae bacterium]
MLKMQTLSSGSKGNITYVTDNNTKILIDIGLRLKHTLARLEAACISPNEITAILITHEHFDHIKGIRDFCRLYNTKVYVHEELKHFLSKQLNLTDEYFETFNDSFFIDQIKVDFFNVPHDSHFCFGYTFNSTVGIATDIGKMTNEILAHLSLCTAVILESNHDKDKLAANLKYPPWLKQRILSPRGHLSNTECANAIKTLAQHNTKHVTLAHLSEENNSPTLAYSVIQSFLQGSGIKIDIAPQNEIGVPIIVD